MTLHALLHVLGHAHVAHDRACGEPREACLDEGHDLAALKQDLVVEAELLLVDDAALAVHVVLFQQVPHDLVQTLRVRRQEFLESLPAEREQRG